MKVSNGYKVCLVLLGFVGCHIISRTESAYADFTCGTTTNLDCAVNSTSNEEAPSISADGLELYFDSDRLGGEGLTDIWVSKRESVDANWSEPNNLGSLVNSSALEAQPDICANGLELYFHSNANRPGWQGLSDIWVSERKSVDANWGEPCNVGPPVNTAGDEWDPSISSDGLTLYFASDRRSVYDAPSYPAPVRIWVSHRETKNDPWGDPWPVLGTDGRPVAQPACMPDISFDGLMLFFASGPYKMYGPLSGGYGGYDIWVTSREPTKAYWTKPVNLGPCFNTVYAESAPSISSDGRVLYFSDWDDRRQPGGEGGYDLWQVSVTDAAGRIIYVDCNATGNYDGSSWADAYNYLQDALAGTRSCDEIHVAKGTYKPDDGAGQTPGDRNATFQLKNCVTIIGGYAGFGQPDPNARDVKVYETILSGDLNNNDVYVNDPCDLLTESTRAENSYHVVYSYGTNETAVLDGFVIIGGNANGQGYPVYQNYGGGMYNNKDGIPTIRNCTFSGNSAEVGGGMCNDDSSPTLTNCTFSGNSAIRGGGIYNLPFGSNPMLTNCAFSGNFAQNNGGGMYNWYSDPNIKNCTFSGNSSQTNGGGMYNWNSDPTLTICTFSGNLANDGAGMCNDASSPEVTNCKFSGNSAGENGGGMSSYDNSNPAVTDCIVTSNTANFGGGMYNRDSNTTVTNCTFSNNTASTIGGGMSNWECNPTLTDCTFSGNSADRGGGMSNHSSSTTLTNSKFIGNSSQEYGGGIYNYNSSSPTVINCAFIGNTAANAGGGMFNGYYSSPTVINCAFSGNPAVKGGGIYNASSSNPTVSNCAFSGNTASTDGGGMYNYDSTPIVTNCIFWGDEPNEIIDDGSSSTTVTYSDVEGSWGGTGNIDAEPCFVDTDNPDPNLWNLRLKPDSPCIDAGDSTEVLAMSVVYDLDGKDRYVDIDTIDDTGSGLFEFLDMGAYEFICNYIDGDNNCDGVVDFKDVAILCGNWLAGK